MEEKKVIVIGAGLGGLSAASRLASKGYDVEVFETRPGPGGKADEFFEAGYRWDTGPSLLTLPTVLSQLFEELGTTRSKYLEIVELDPITRYFYPDGTIIDAYSDRNRFAEEIEEKTGEKADVVLDYLDHCRNIYDLTSGMFMYKSLGEISTFFSRDALRSLTRIREIDAFRTMHEANSRWFKDERVVQLFDRYATYNGSSPYLTPATFNLIQHVEYGIGGYAVKGGIYRITKALTKIAMDKGAVFHFNTPVEKIITEGRTVKGVKAEGKEIPSNIVISNSDVSNTYDELLRDPRTRSARRYSRLEPSSSGGVFYWGVGSNNEELLVNNIFFSSDYRKEFKDIWEYRRSPLDPTVYVNITSKVDPEDARDGGENWFVLMNVPYDSGQNWKDEMGGLRERAITRVEASLGREIAKKIEVERSLDPIEIGKRWSTNKGSIYGISSNDRGSAFKRQNNRSRECKGLYFCGGSAHPGGGMPLVILSGKITADLIDR